MAENLREGGMILKVHKCLYILLFLLRALGSLRPGARQGAQGPRAVQGLAQHPAEPERRIGNVR